MIHVGIRPSPSNCDVPTNSVCLTLSALAWDKEGRNIGDWTEPFYDVLGLGLLVWNMLWWRVGKWVFLWLGEVLSDNLSGLRGDPVRKTDCKLHNEITTLWRVLGKRQSFPSDPLHCPRLDDVMTGERDDAVLQRGNANCAATQRLQRERTGEEIERVNVFSRNETPETRVSWWLNVSMNKHINLPLHPKCFYVCVSVKTTGSTSHW